jgi:hypothetical protein
MKTLMLSNRHLLLGAACTGLAVFAMGFAGNAQARDNLAFSISVGGPHVLMGATYAYPVYSQPQPVYMQPRSVYVQPVPVYYRAAPVYYAPPVYAIPQPVYYDRPLSWKQGHYKNYHKHDGHQQGYNGQGYASVYYQP